MYYFYVYCVVMQSQSSSHFVNLYAGHTHIQLCAGKGAAAEHAVVSDGQLMASSVTSRIHAVMISMSDA
jgi:hypothetical protein